jgi:hypothetical protein
MGIEIGFMIHIQRTKFCADLFFVNKLAAAGVAVLNRTLLTLAPSLAICMVLIVYHKTWTRNKTFEFNRHWNQCKRQMDLTQKNFCLKKAKLLRSFFHTVYSILQ